MQPPQQHSWINLAELKTQIVRKLGPDRSKQYFDYLNKFLSLKLTKVEFDKLCLRTIGKDGILLHNQLIRSILSNACNTNKKPLDGVRHQNRPGPIVAHASSQPVIPNGDILSTSPRKARTGGRDRRGGDRKSILGPNGKPVYSSPSSSIPHSDDFNLDNGNSSSPDTRKPMQHHQELMQQAQNADGRVKPLGQQDGGKISLHAPLGIPYYPASIGGARKAPPIKTLGVSDTNGLLDTVTLRARMEPVSIAHGLQGVSPDSSNVLNNGLDSYLRRLIRSCCELSKPSKSNPAHFRLVNGVMPPSHEPKHPISLLDFRVAMELNPQQLGEDWPILLERIHTYGFEQ